MVFDVWIVAKYPIKQVSVSVCLDYIYELNDYVNISYILYMNVKV